MQNTKYLQIFILITMFRLFLNSSSLSVLHSCWNSGMLVTNPIVLSVITPSSCSCPSIVSRAPKATILMICLRMRMMIIMMKTRSLGAPPGPDF